MKMYFLRLSCVLLALQGCASQQQVPTPEDMGPMPAPVIEEEPVSSESVFGPEAPIESLPPIENLPPIEHAPTVVEPEKKIPEPKLCIVLGPGMVRGFASSGVIESMVKAEIPVNCVLGVETGAVVGALYALNPKINALQWQIFKINGDNYLDKALFKSQARAKKMRQFFGNIFGNKKFSDLKFPFITSASEPNRPAALYFLEEDGVAESLSASISVMGIFEPWQFRNRKLVSSAWIDPLPINKAREVGATLVVAVNVLSGLRVNGEDDSRKYQEIFLPIKNLVDEQKKQADVVIEPELSGIPLEDFTKQSEVIAAGRDAGDEAAEKIKSLWEAEMQRYRCAIDPENCEK